jgi:hypothetical protein
MIRPVAAAATVVALLAGCAAPGGKSLAPSTSTTGSSPSSSAPAAAAPTSTSSSTSTTTPPAPPRDPRLSDFKVGYKTKSKQCFGSAGCNWVIAPTVKWVGPAASKPTDDATSYEITISVSGDESGPTIATITTHGSRYDADEIDLSTPRISTPVKIKATGLEKVS